MKRSGWAWEESVEGIMQELGLSREDAQFVYDYKRGRVKYDLRLVPKIMRIFGLDERLACRSLMIHTVFKPMGLSPSQPLPMDPESRAEMDRLMGISERRREE